MPRPKLSAISPSFIVSDVDRTIAFYRKHVHLHVAHERAEDGRRVVIAAQEVLTRLG